MRSNHPTEQPYPPTFLALVNKYRKEDSFKTYFCVAIGSFIVLLAIHSWIVTGDANVLVILPVGGAISALGWYGVWESSISHFRELIERDLSKYSNRDEVLREIEDDLNDSPIIGSGGALTERWVLSAHVYDQPLVWPIEQIDVVHWSSFRGYRWMKLYFVSGRYVVLADSRHGANAMFEQLENRFGLIAVTPEAAKILDDYDFPSDQIRERSERRATA